MSSRPISASTKKRRSQRTYYVELHGERSYGAIEAVKGVSHRSPPGEVVTIIGANGAGKSTLLKAIAGLHPVAGGQHHDGRQGLHRTPGIRVRLGMALSPEAAGSLRTRPSREPGAGRLFPKGRCGRDRRCDRA